MRISKRIFLIADFREHRLTSIRHERRHWVKGFMRLGHDVQRFSYRNIMLQCSSFPRKRIARYFSKKKADRILLDQVKHYNPNVIMILTMKDLDAETVSAMREVGPNAIFVGRDTDWFPQENKSRIAIAKQMDAIVATYAGYWLRFYKNAGVPICAFIPNPCDPDIQRPYELNDAFKTDVIFTGKARQSTHSKNEEHYDMDRYSIVKKLSKMPNAKVYGAFGNSKIEGIDCFYAISGAKIALSINAVNNVRMYHSDRFVNCLSCGTFVLAKRVPDSDLLFQDGVHLRYFDTPQEFFDLVDFYLRKEKEREKIAKAGMERAHAEFNCEKIAKHVLDLVDTGTYDAQWAEIL